MLDSILTAYCLTCYKTTGLLQMHFFGDNRSACTPYLAIVQLCGEDVGALLCSIHLLASSPRSQLSLSALYGEGERRAHACWLGSM